MLWNHLFQWLLCFQHCSPPQRPPTTIHSPSTADPLKGLCGLQMQIKSSGAYQLCSKKKRKINHFWRLSGMLGLQVTEKKENKGNTVVQGRETQINKDEVGKSGYFN